MSDEADTAGRDRRDRIGFVLLGAGIAWNVGTVGPTATAIGDEFDLSLGTVGALTGSAFFVGLVAAKLVVAGAIGRFGTPTVARVCCLAALVGNLMIALSPVALGVGVGRFLCGGALGLALVLGPVLARASGGAKQVGLFGASVTFGTAAALGVGSLMRSAGVDWRFDFLLAAVVAAVALAALPVGIRAEVSSGSILALLRRNEGRVRALRLELLFVATLGVPYVIGVWLVPYLTEDVALSAGAAGVLAATMYVTVGLLRPEGARLEAGGASRVLLGGVAPLVAALGLALLAWQGVPAVVALGVVVAGIGFAIPYAAMFGEAHGLYPDAGMAGVGLLSVGANLLPALLLPPVGSAIESGRGDLGILALAAVSLVAGLANLRPVAER